MQRTELVNEIGMKVAPIRLSERATFRHSTGSGQAAQETEPQGKAAAEVDALWRWICQQVGMLPRQRANTPAKVPA
jgi:chromosome partitioning protein